MEALENILREITSFENQLSRRGFLKLASMTVIFPGLSLEKDDREFLRSVAATLIPAAPGVNPSWTIMALARHVAINMLGEKRN